VRAGSKRPIHDQCRNAKNSQGHRGHDVKLPNDPNAKDTQWLAASCSSEKEHEDSNRNQNKTAREIHGSFSNPLQGHTITEILGPHHKRASIWGKKRKALGRPAGGFRGNRAVCYRLGHLAGNAGCKGG
jgi:hypothetical protein